MWPKKHVYSSTHANLSMAKPIWPTLSVATYLLRLQCFVTSLYLLQVRYTFVLRTRPVDYILFTTAGYLARVTTRSCNCICAFSTTTNQCRCHEVYTMQKNKCIDKTWEGTMNRTLTWIRLQWKWTQLHWTPQPATHPFPEQRWRRYHQYPTMKPRMQWLVTQRHWTMVCVWM